MANTGKIGKGCVRDRESGIAGVAARVLLCSGIQIVCFWAMVMTLCSCGLFVDLTPNAVYLIVSFFASIALLYYLSSWKKVIVIMAGALSLAALVISCMIAAQFIDWSYDGNMYHKVAVVALADGWNPLKGTVADTDTFLSVYDAGANAALWIDHYAEGIWAFSACIYSLTHDLEMAKCYTLLAMFAVGFLLTGLLRIQGYKWWQAGLVGIVAAANPISLAQFTVYYNDAFLMLSLGTLLIGLIVIADSSIQHIRNLALLLVVCAFVGCVGTKFTGLAYAGVFSLAFYALYVVFFLKGGKGFDLKALIKIGATLIAVVVFSVLVVGFSPYVTNFINEGHPFYPLFGEGAVDIMTSNSPSWITNASDNVQRVAMSLFSPVSNSYVGNEPAIPTFKTPLTWTDVELVRLQSCDLRLSGFGVLFSGVFLACCIIAPVALEVWYRRCRLMFACFAVYLITTIALMLGISDSWWARYSGYSYYFVVFVLVFLLWGINTYQRRAGKTIRAISATVLSILVLTNSIFFIVYNVYPHYMESRSWNKTIGEWEDVTQSGGAELHIGVVSSQPGLVFTLRDRGIPFIYEGRDPEGFDPDKKVQHLLYRIDEN